jgi:hypothetical protein
VNTKKCAICKQARAEVAWQPFGPGVCLNGCFSPLGWHYFGYPVVQICDACEQRIRDGEPVVFQRGSRRYVARGMNVEVAPQVEAATMAAAVG